MSSGRSRPSGFSSLVLTLLLACGSYLYFKPAGRVVQGQTHVVDGDSLRLGGTDIRLKGIHSG